jgi:predicted RNase H-like nuclease (RuvC/YqgF family)
MIIYAKRERNNKLIAQVQSSDTTNVDIRLYSRDRYKQLNLPEQQ